MPSDPRKLRRAVAARLAITATVVASVAGGVAFLKARSDVGGAVLALAVDEARDLVPDVAFLSDVDRPRYEQRRAAAGAHVLREHVRGGRFVSIEIYDRERQLVLDATDPLHVDVRAVVEAARHERQLADAPTSRRVEVGRDTYLQVFAPLVTGGQTVAYLDGVYEVDPVTLARLDRGVLELVLAVVGAILVTALVLYPVLLALQGDLLGVTEELAHANMALLASLGSAVAKRDRDTNTHNHRVTIYAIRLGVAVGLQRAQIRALVKGAFLHDVGKIAVADAILKKAGPLTTDERTAMQAHVAHGLEIVGGATWLEDALDVVRFHHEKVDGTGYPAGLRGDQIPIVARVFAIVDVFDALTSRRPYKAPISLEAALATLQAGRGTSFDPALLDAFLALAPDLHRRFSARPEGDLARALDVLLVEYFGVGATAAAAGSVALAALAIPPRAPGSEAAVQ